MICMLSHVGEASWQLHIGRGAKEIGPSGDKVRWKMSMFIEWQWAEVRVWLWLLRTPVVGRSLRRLGGSWVTV